MVQNCLFPTRTAKYQFSQGKGNEDHVLPLIDSGPGLWGPPLQFPSLALGPKLGADEPLISDLKPLRAFVQYVCLHTYLFVADF